MLRRVAKCYFLRLPTFVGYCRLGADDSYTTHIYCDMLTPRLLRRGRFALDPARRLAMYWAF